MVDTTRGSIIIPMEESEGTNRLNSFKNFGKDPNEMRRRRMEECVELRKARRDEQLLKKRNISVIEPVAIEISTLQQKFSCVTELAEGICNPVDEVKLHALQATRKILSRERNPPIDEIIQAGIVPLLVNVLDYDKPNFIFEAAWALTNIASGKTDQTDSVVKAGVIPKLVLLLSSRELNVAEQCVWALGNIAGDGPDKRDMVLQAGAMPLLLELIKRDLPESTLRNIVWAVSNLCRSNNPSPDFSYIQMCLPVLCSLLDSKSLDILTDACWTLSYITDGSNDRIQAVVDTGVVPKIVRLLESSSVEVLTPALRAVGNIVTGNDQQTDAVIHAGALPLICMLLKHSRPNIMKEAAWAVSNITAGNKDQIQEVINNGLIEPLISVISQGDFKAKKEATWALTNLISDGTHDQVKILFCKEVIEPFCNLLNVKDWNLIMLVTDGIRNMLQIARKISDELCETVELLIEDCGGLDILEELQNHENEEIYNKVHNIVSEFFCE